MSIDEWTNMDATAMAACVRRGEVTPLDLVDAAIARIERHNPVLNAVIHPRYDKARDEAGASLPDGPFKGVPLLVKDLMCQTAGDPYHGGMQFLKNLNWTAPHDNYLAQRYREAGFVIVGRTNTPEFGAVTTTEPLAYGPTHNPWDLSRSPGGSSGGSATAVAARLVPVANAGDGGGSIRVPASCCGLFGLKPTRGRISSGPDRGEMWLGFAVQHVLTISVRDSAAILDATAIPFTGDPYYAPPPATSFTAALTEPLPKLRIGILRHVPNGQVALHADCLAAVDDAAKLLEDLGHVVEESHPQALAEIDEEHRFMNIVAASVTRDIAEYAAMAGREPEPDELEPATHIMRKMGSKLSAVDYLNTQIYLQSRARPLRPWGLMRRPTTIPFGRCGALCPLLRSHRISTPRVNPLLQSRYGGTTKVFPSAYNSWRATRMKQRYSGLRHNSSRCAHGPIACQLIFQQREQRSLDEAQRNPGVSDGRR